MLQCALESFTSVHAHRHNVVNTSGGLPLAGDTAAPRNTTKSATSHSLRARCIHQSTPKALPRTAGSHTHHQPAPLPQPTRCVPPTPPVLQLPPQGPTSPWLHDQGATSAPRCALLPGSPSPPPANHCQTPAEHLPQAAFAGQTHAQPALCPPAPSASASQTANATGWSPPSRLDNDGQ